MFDFLQFLPFRSMPYFRTSDDLRLSYLDEGEAGQTPVLLIHGFASNIRVNWMSTGWVRHLRDAGYRVLAMDVRGHGESDKPHDPTVYTGGHMVDDAMRLLDHVRADRVFVMGYSMGARVTALTALAHPDRLRGVVLSGLGENLVKGMDSRDAIVEALRAPSLDLVSDPQGRTFRAFAEATGGDLEALAACMQSMRTTVSPQEASTISTPTLIAVGSDDEVAGDPEVLADLIPNAQAFVIKGRDHMKAVGDRSHKNAVVAFLERLV